MFNRKVLGIKWVTYMLNISAFCVVTPGEIGQNFLSTSPEEIICEVCQKTFKRKDYLKQHMKIHAPERDMCRCPREGCGRTYTTVFNLQSHILAFHEEWRPFVCEHAGCGKTFATRVSPPTCAGSPGAPGPTTAAQGLQWGGCSRALGPSPLGRWPWTGSTSATWNLLEA